MRQSVILTIALCCATATSMAQTYTKHLQQKEPGRGTVVVKQSADIDELVNTTDVSHNKKTTPTPTRQDVTPAKKTTSPTSTPEHKTPATEHKTTTPEHKATTPEHKTTTPEHKTTTPENKSTVAEHKPAAKPAPTHSETETETPSVDTRQKVMRRSYKVKGYRVQVYAGGNSREDKNKAQRAGNALKAAFPNQPVYVHFYSPRWVCRMGNFRSYEEASHVLREVQKLGYKQACIVSGQITVAY